MKPSVSDMYTRSIQSRVSAAHKFGVLSFFLTQHMLLFALASWLCWWLLVVAKSDLITMHYCLHNALLCIYFSLILNPRHGLDSSDQISYSWCSSSIPVFWDNLNLNLVINCYIASSSWFCIILNLESDAFSLAHDPRPVFSLQLQLLIHVGSIDYCLISRILGPNQVFK